MTRHPPTDAPPLKRLPAYAWLSLALSTLFAVAGVLSIALRAELSAALDYGITLLDTVVLFGAMAVFDLPFVLALLRLARERQPRR